MPPLALAPFPTKNPLYLHNPRPPRQRLPSCLLIENVSAIEHYGFSKRSRAETFPIKASDDTDTNGSLVLSTRVESGELFGRPVARRALEHGREAGLRCLSDPKCGHLPSRKWNHGLEHPADP